MGSYSIFQSVRHLMGQPLFCSAAHAGVWGREAMVMAPLPTCGSAVPPCFHGCLAFLHRHFPPQSPLSHPLDLSLHSQQQPSPWDCSTIPKLQLPAPVPSRGPAFLSGVCTAAARTVWFSFHLGCHWWAVSLFDLNISPVTQTMHLRWGSDCCFSSPPTKGRPCPTNTPALPPSSFILLRFVWFYIFFSTGQVLLSTLSRCSACTTVSEVVFLMHLWRETYSTSTYSPAILFSPIACFFVWCFVSLKGTFSSLCLEAIEHEKNMLSLICTVCWKLTILYPM